LTTARPHFAIRKLPFALCALLAVSGCVGTGALRGVGAPSVPQQATGKVERTIIQANAREEKLREGTPLNLAVDASNGAAGEPQTVPPSPQLAATRPEAVTEIRAKAAATGKNKPNVFDIPQPSSGRMTKEEIDAARAELAAAAARNDQALPADGNAKSASAAALKKKAQTHYNSAVAEIEN
jgi:hypothetical protein